MKNYVKLRGARGAKVQLVFFDDASPRQARDALGLAELAEAAAVFRRPPFQTWDGIPQVGECAEDDE